MQSLPHVSSVRSVAIDWREEIVAAGESTGIIKLWDTAQQKVIRTLNSHSDPIKSLTFHPFGDFFVSSTIECLKVWDIRRKECIQTYPTHLSNLCITPDGKWVAGVNEYGVEVWDMTSGGKLYDFKVEGTKYCGFHPSKLSMMTGGSKGVCFYDLVTGTKDDALSINTQSTVELIQFGYDDTLLYAIHTNGITICRMGPSLQVIDEIQYKLGDVKDSMLKEGHLRIASTHMNSVTIVSIDSKNHLNCMSNPKKIVTVETGLSDSFTAINRDLIVQETKDYTLCPRQKVMKLLPLSMNSPLDIPYSPFLDITRHTSTIEGEYLDKHAEIMDIIHYRLQTHIKTKELFDTHSKLECMFKGECWQTNDLIKRAKGLSKTIDDFMVVLRACIDLCVEMVEEWVVGACLCMHGMILKFRGIMDAQCLKGLIEFKGCLINIGSIKGTDALKDVIELIDKL